MDTEIKLFETCLEELNLDISTEQMNQFIRYYEILVEKNKVMNLTGITEFHEVIIKHFVDSLTIVKILDLNKIKNMIDMGTGAGFPGIPIKIMFPEIDVLLMDSLNKRIKFLNEACQEIGLHNVNAIHGRAEDLGRNKEYREQFDLCVSRAVANLSVLGEYCMPFVRVHGNFVCYKAGNSDEEIGNAQKAIRLLSGEIKEKVDFQIPQSDISRTLLRIQKVKEISKTYPRKAGVPAKNPLG